MKVDKRAKVLLLTIFDHFLNKIYEMQSVKNSKLSDFFVLAKPLESLF